MENYRKSSHTVYDIKYHIVWITKDRKPVLRAVRQGLRREWLNEAQRQAIENENYLVFRRWEEGVRLTRDKENMEWIIIQ